MTTLDERPVAAEEPPEPHPRARGLLAFLTTTDHKSIGISYMVTAFAFYLIGGALATAYIYGSLVYFAWLERRALARRAVQEDRDKAA